MPDDKPIIIKGGSVELTFDSVFEDLSDPADPKKPKKYKNKDAKFTAMLIVRSDDSTETIKLKNDDKIYVLYETPRSRDEKENC